jgi:hypothetical protein
MAPPPGERPSARIAVQFAFQTDTCGRNSAIDRAQPLLRDDRLIANALQAPVKLACGYDQVLYPGDFSAHRLQLARNSRGERVDLLELLRQLHELRRDQISQFERGADRIDVNHLALHSRSGGQYGFHLPHARMAG